MQTIKKNKKIILQILLSLLLIAGWFYWFQIRPMNIRKSCVNEAMKSYSEKRRNNAYRICLVKKGLSPESLLVNIE